MHQPEGLPRGVQIAECRDGYFLPHTDEAKANARLIAAAPDLYASAKAIAEILRGWPMPGMQREFNALCEAIDKAEWSAA